MHLGHSPNMRSMSELFENLLTDIFESEAFRIVKPSATREPWVPALLKVEWVIVDRIAFPTTKLDEHSAFFTTFFVNVQSVHVSQFPTHPISPFVAQRALSRSLRSCFRLSKTRWWMVVLFPEILKRKPTGSFPITPFIVFAACRTAHELVKSHSGLRTLTPAVVSVIPRLTVKYE